MNKRLIALPVAIAALAAGAWWFKDGGTAHKGDLVLHGNMDIRQAALAFDASGRIERVLVEEGATVAAGQTLATLDGGRISIGALSVGLAQGAFEAAVNYARQREAFGSPIAQFQAIQWMIADAALEIDAARLMVWRAAWLKDQGRSFSKEAAMAKLLASEVAERVCHNAIQILGSYGYSAEFPVERMYRDQRLMSIGEGTSQIQRLVIARRVLAEMA